MSDTSAPSVSLADLDPLPYRVLCRSCEAVLIERTIGDVGEFVTCDCPGWDGRMWIEPIREPQP